MNDLAFALGYTLLWVGFFAVLFRLARQSRELQDTIRRIKRHLHSGWPDPE